ncbi:MAG: hypothetical protein A4E53_01806 [Pelotomaculum sp. PtaB.Bin104]|nr:MAG: hypothetical protein A4E53_01806 [Pelotomaculum sp. PtaB.Bin104]
MIVEKNTNKIQIISPIQTYLKHIAMVVGRQGTPGNKCAFHYEKESWA